MTTVLKILNTFNKNEGKQTAMVLLNAFMFSFSFPSLSPSCCTFNCSKVRITKSSSGFQCPFKFFFGIYFSLSYFLKYELTSGQPLCHPRQQKSLYVIWLWLKNFSLYSQFSFWWRNSIITVCLFKKDFVLFWLWTGVMRHSLLLSVTNIWSVVNHLTSVVWITPWKTGV